MVQYVILVNSTSDTRNGQVENFQLTLVNAANKTEAIKKFVLWNSTYPISYFIEIYEERVPSPFKNSEILKSKVKSLMKALLKSIGQTLDELLGSDYDDPQFENFISDNIDEFVDIFQQYQEADSNHFQVYTVPSQECYDGSVALLDYA